MTTILIIEDEKDLAELVAFNLGKEGYRTILAAYGVAGLAAARSNSPDLILLDLMLPGMQGTEICKILKHEEATATTPIIMLTAKGEEIDRVVGFEVGADLKTDDPVDLFPLGGQHDNRRSGGGFLVLENLADLGSLHAGEHQVEENQVR